MAENSPVLSARPTPKKQPYRLTVNRAHHDPYLTFLVRWWLLGEVAWRAASPHKEGSWLDESKSHWQVLLTCQHSFVTYIMQVCNIVTWSYISNRLTFSQTTLVSFSKPNQVVLWPKPDITVSVQQRSVHLLLVRCNIHVIVAVTGDRSLMCCVWFTPFNLVQGSCFQQKLR